MQEPATSTPQSRQVLEFVTVVGEAKRGTGDEEYRRVVRSHAIRDANRRKKYSSDVDVQQVPLQSPSKPLPQGKFTAKFRVDSQAKRKAKTHSKDQEISRDVEGRLGRVKTAPRQSTLIPGMSLNLSSSFDPFDSLPITMGSKEKALMQYQKTALINSAFAFYSKERLFTYASVDPAWLNATLSLISLHYDLKQGKGISRECLYHRGEALRIVNERLLKSPGEITDHTIGAIASLANFDTTNGLFSSATMHIQGLIQILSNRGSALSGLWSLKGNEMLQKIVAWSDLCYATTWDLPPKFPILRSEICRASLDEYLPLFAPLFGSPDLTSPHDLFGEMTSIFQALRLLSICMTRSTVGDLEQAMFSRGVYVTEYNLLVVLDETDPRDNDIVLSRNSHIYGSCRLAAYLYLYIALREVPRSAEIVHILARRLKTVLQGNSADLLLVWKDDLHLLLWIVSMGAFATPGIPERDYFVDIWKRVRDALGLKSLDMFTSAIKEVLWTDESCWIQACEGLWDTE